MEQQKHELCFSGIFYGESCTVKRELFMLLSQIGKIHPSIPFYLITPEDTNILEWLSAFEFPLPRQIKIAERDLPSLGRWSAGVWLKLEIFSLQQCERVIYLDLDIYILKPFIKEILESCPESAPFCASPLTAYSLVAIENPTQVFEINSGVLVIKPRANWTHELVLEASKWQRNSARPPSAEQEFLNFYFSQTRELTYISEKYNCQARGARDCYIHHFLGSNSIEELLRCRFIDEHDYPEVTEYSKLLQASFDVLPPCNISCSRWAPIPNAYSNCYHQMHAVMRSQQFLEAHRLEGWAYTREIATDPAGQRLAMCMIFRAATCWGYIFVALFCLTLHILTRHLKSRRHRKVD